MVATPPMDTHEIDFYVTLFSLKSKLRKFTTYKTPFWGSLDDIHTGSSAIFGRSAVRRGVTPPDIMCMFKIYIFHHNISVYSS